MLYDTMKPFVENPICPTCAMEMHFVSTSRRRNGTYVVLRYECPICHLRQNTTTRNNERMDYLFVFGMIVAYFAIVVFTVTALL